MILPQHMCVYKHTCVDVSNAHVRVYKTCVYEVSTDGFFIVSKRGWVQSLPEKIFLSMFFQ